MKTKADIIRGCS